MHYLEDVTIGAAWIKAIRAVLLGDNIKDGEDNLKEVLNMIISINNPPVTDKIIDRFADNNMIVMMKNNFFVQTPINGWGYSYAQRIYNYKGFNQYEEVKNKLLKNPDAKSATIVLTNPPEDKLHSPCINVMDFKLRKDKLILNAFFRSQDIGKKMYADAICLNKILDDMANSLNTHSTQMNLYIMSAHIYGKDYKRMEEILGAID